MGRGAFFVARSCPFSSFPYPTRNNNTRTSNHYNMHNSYRPSAGCPSSSPDPATYPESRAYRLTWAWRRGGALTRDEADALRLAVERRIETTMAGKAVMRRGKSFGVGDVTYEESGLWQRP